MPAAMRGESRAEAKPRAKAPASTKSAPRARKPGAAYAPGKLGAARGVGGIDSWGTDVEEPYHVSGEGEHRVAFRIVL